MLIVRLSRTFPRVKFPGIGLHAYYFSKYINIPTIVFTKHIDNSPLDIPDNVVLEEISYKDLSFSKEKENIFRLIFILLSKVFGEIFFTFKTFSYLLRSKEKATLIHLHCINYLFTALLMKYIFRAPLIINFGGTDLLRVGKYGFLRLAVNCADRVLYVAKSMEHDLLTIFNKNKLVYMGNGVDLTQFYNKGFERKKQFVAIGNLRWQKGYSDLIEAFRRVIDRYPQYKLIIAGEGEQRDQIQEAISKLDLYNNVTLVGMQNRGQLVNLLNYSYGFVMSSVSEGLPKSLLEAIACETPVIVTDVGECKYIAEGVGLVSRAGDVEGLSNSMIHFIESKKYWEKYSNECKLSRLNYSWKNMTDKVLNSYKDILD